MLEAPRKEHLPAANGTNLGEAEPVRAYPGLGAGSLFCCPACRAWTRHCGVGYCQKESLATRAERKAARADAVRYQVFLHRWPARAPQEVAA